MVIKHAEGNNNQDLAWKFCVVEQTVQCWKKQKGLLIKEENSNQKGHQMAKGSLGQKIKCRSQEERNAAFKCCMVTEHRR
jgi:uncharacterized protein YjcR